MTQVVHDVLALDKARKVDLISSLRPADPDLLEVTASFRLFNHGLAQELLDELMVVATRDRKSEDLPGVLRAPGFADAREPGL